jgi:hypothetical protein
MLKVFVHVAALMCYHTRFSTLSHIHQDAVTCHVLLCFLLCRRQAAESLLPSLVY